MNVLPTWAQGPADDLAAVGSHVVLVLSHQIQAAPKEGHICAPGVVLLLTEVHLKGASTKSALWNEAVPGSSVVLMRPQLKILSLCPINFALWLRDTP